MSRGGSVQFVYDGRMTSSSSSDDPQRADYRLIARRLRESIESGAYQPGDKLPSERVLATEHNAARNTAREAIAQLRREGLVTAEHGRGVFVRTKPRWMRFGRLRYAAAMRSSNDLGPFGAEAAAQGRTPHVDCTSIARVEPPPEVAERLQITASTFVVRRENWYFADNEPMQMGVTYSPWEVVEGTPVADSEDMGPTGIYGQFDARGYVITYIREEITARVPTPQEAKRLQIPDGVPVIDLWHTGIDANKKPFEVTNFVMRADVTALDYDMPVGSDEK